MQGVRSRSLEPLPVEASGIWAIFIDKLHKERDDFIHLMCRQIDRLKNYVKENTKDDLKALLLERGSCLASYIPKDVNNKTLSATNVDNLKDFCDSRIASIKEIYENQEKKIRSQMVSSVVLSNDEASMEKDANGAFLKKFSLYSKNQMEKEIKCFRLMVVWSLVETSFIYYLKHELDIWNALIHSKFCSLYNYSRRYAKTSLTSIEEALQQGKHHKATYAFFFNVWKLSLEEIVEKDAGQMLSALDATCKKLKNNVTENMNLIFDRMSILRAEELSVSYDIYERSYDYFVQHFAINDNFYKESPLANPEVVTSSIDAFVSKKLICIRESSHVSIMRRCNSEISLLSGEIRANKEAPF